MPGSGASDDRSQREKDRDWQNQIRLEYWKTQYDFQKHVTTVGLLAAAGFTALLGGFFKILSVIFASIAALLSSLLEGSIQDKDPQPADATNNTDDTGYEKRFE